MQTPASRTFSSSQTESPHSLNTNSPAPCPGSHYSYLFSVSECNCSRPLLNWVPSPPSRAPSRPPPHLGTCPQYPSAGPCPSASPQPTAGTAPPPLGLTLPPALGKMQKPTSCYSRMQSRSFCGLGLFLGPGQPHLCACLCCF